MRKQQFTVVAAQGATSILLYIKLGPVVPNIGFNPPVVGHKTFRGAME